MACANTCNLIELFKFAIKTKKIFKSETFSGIGFVWICAHVKTNGRTSIADAQYWSWIARLVRLVYGLVEQNGHIAFKFWVFYIALKVCKCRLVLNSITYYMKQ